jgi:hypothetical protein
LTTTQDAHCEDPGGVITLALTRDERRDAFLARKA